MTAVTTTIDETGGVRSAWASRITIPGGVWEETVRDAREQVDMLGTALGGFAHSATMRELARDRLSNGATFRLVLQSPYADAAHSMAMQKNEPIDHKVNAALESLNAFIASLSSDERSRFGVRCYASWMGFAMFRGDDRMLVTGILPWVIVDTSPTLDVRRTDGGIFEAYAKSFDGIWAHSQAI